MQIRENTYEFVSNKKTQFYIFQTFAVLGSNSKYFTSVEILNKLRSYKNNTYLAQYYPSCQT